MGRSLNMRSYIRHPSDIPIEYQEDKQDSGVSQERLNDISKSGLSFSSTKKLNPGNVITIRIACVQPIFEARAQAAREWIHKFADDFPCLEDGTAAWLWLWLV